MQFCKVNAKKEKAKFLNKSIDNLENMIYNKGQRKSKSKTNLYIMLTKILYQEET